MKRILNLFACVLLLYSAPVYSQCACCSSVGCGDNSGSGKFMAEKGKILFNLVGRYTGFTSLSSTQLVTDAVADTISPVYNKSYQYTYIISATYGISNRFNTTVVLPYNSITNIQTAAPGAQQAQILGTSAGLSNIKTSLQFVLLQPQYCKGWKVVPSVGVIAPTGTHSNVAKDGTFFDDQFQPGANSWVPVLGITGDKLFNKVKMRATFVYVFKYTDPQGNVDAALWNGDVSAYFPLYKPHNNITQTHDTTGTCVLMQHRSSFILSGFLGVQSEHVGQDIMAMDNGYRVPDANIGAFRMYASAGVVVNFSHHLFMPLSIAVPFYQMQNGYQVSVKCRISGGFSFLL